MEIWIAVVEYPKGRPTVLVADTQDEAFRLAVDTAHGWLVANRPDVEALASQEIDHTDEPEAWNEELFSITPRPCVSTHITHWPAVAPCASRRGLG